MTKNLAYLTHPFLAAALASVACDEQEPAANIDAAPVVRDAGADAAVTPDTARDTTSARDVSPEAPASACAPANLATYTSASYDTNAAAELGVRQSFSAFLQPMRDAAMDLTKKPTAAELKAIYDMGMPTLRSITTGYYAGKIDEWLGVFEAAAGNMWTPAEPPPATGGKYLMGDIYSKEGLDIRQAIEKGMFGAAFYNHALTLMSGQVSPATVDRLIAIFGAHPTFPKDDGAMAMNRDIWVASYAKRRTNPAAPMSSGIYYQIKANFIAAQAAAAGGASCTTELQAALKSLRDNWEKALFATVIYYANDTKTKLGQVMDMNFGPALHNIGEASSFVHGYRMLPAASRKITDAQIDEILLLFGAPATGAVTTYKFATDTTTQVPKLDEAIAKVKTIYGWSDADVEGFKTNY
jgi:hypothetical protein